MVVERRYNITLTAQVPLRIGGPQDLLSQAENPVAIVGGRVVVPGSSLKGRLRAEIESMLIDSYYDAANQAWPSDKRPFQPCLPTTNPSQDELGLVRAGRYRDKWEPERGGPGWSCTYTDREASPSICPACYFLGAMGLPGFVRVPFLYADGSPAQLYSATMDRATGTVRSGTNRPYDLVPQGTRFTGALAVVMQDTRLAWRLGQRRPVRAGTQGDAWLPQDGTAPQELLETFILKPLRAISLLGGYKSKGFGEVRLTVELAG